MFNFKIFILLVLMFNFLFANENYIDSLMPESDTDSEKVNAEVNSDLINHEVDDLMNIHSPKSDIVALSTKAKMGSEEDAEKYINAAVLLENIYYERLKYETIIALYM